MRANLSVLREQDAPRYDHFEMRWRVPRRGVSPPLALGVVVLAVGSLVDVVYHATPAVLRPAWETLPGVGGELAHLAIFAGMTLVVLGLLELGVRTGHQGAVRQAPRPRVIRAERLSAPVASGRLDRQPDRSSQRRA